MFFQKKSPFTGSEKNLLYLLACVQFIAIAEFMVVMPLAPILMKSFQFTPTQFGFIVSSYAFASAVSGIVCALFIDRFDRRLSLLTLFGGLILSTFLCAFSWSYWSLLFGRVLAGIFSGVLGSQIQTVVSETIEPKHRGEALGIVFAAFSLSTVVGVPVGLFFASEFYWGAPFIFLAILGVAALFGCFKVLPSMKSHLQRGVPHPLKDMVALLTKVPILNSFGLTLLMMLSGSFVFPFISSYMVFNLGVSEANLPLVYLFGGGSTFITSRLVGRAADVFGPAKTFRIISLCAIVPVLVMTHLPPLPIVAVIAVAAFFFILVSGRMPPLMSLLTQSVTPSTRGRFLSLNATIQNFAMALGSSGASLLVTTKEDGSLQGFGTIGLISAGLIILSCLWSYRVNRIES